MRTSPSIAACLLLSVIFVACHDDGLSTGGDAGDWLSDSGVHLSDAGDAPPCSTIKSEAQCRATQACVADTCLGCSCTPSFVGCRAVNETPASCPALGCPTPLCCHAQSDCGGLAGTLCEVPPVTLGCGPCNNTPSNCAGDTDCTGIKNGICAPTPCACGGAVTLSCQSGCSGDDECRETELCGTDHRCHGRACGPDCSGNYRCQGTTCERKPCATDAECGTPGFCIAGSCSKYVGQCVTQAS